MKLLNRIFKNWTIEEFTGLLFLTITGITAIIAALLIWLLACTITHINDPAPQPKQTTSQYIDHQGDVKRLCLTYKTGDHVDAISCTLLNDTGNQQ